MSLRKRVLNILFWSVVSAAFIGPGTVTTAAKSGSLFGLELLWVLLFSILACVLLQDAASRITILTGKNIGEIIASDGKGKKINAFLPVLIVIAIAGGAAAYEMGNLIGAREGVMLLFPGKEKVVVLILGFLAGTILFIPSLKFISRFMGVLVMVLGIVFLYAAIKISPPVGEIFKGLFIPGMPAGQEAPWLALALIGTTIVPYNLFLGSGLSTGISSVKEMRLGLVVAILLGGVFSIAVVIVGTSVQGSFTFQALADALTHVSSVNGKILLGAGLFAAGFTSAITAPLASAITLKSLFGHRNPDKWAPNGIYFRLSWLLVLLTGLSFALLNIRPVPAIILAQALNGIILPLVSFLLVYYILKKRSSGSKNPLINSVLLGLTLAVTLVIGMNNLVLAVYKSLGLSLENPAIAFIAYSIVAVCVTVIFFIRVLKKEA